MRCKMIKAVTTRQPLRHFWGSFAVPNNLIPLIHGRYCTHSRDGGCEFLCQIAHIRARLSARRCGETQLIIITACQRELAA